jgi:hypothetical protein
MCTNRFSSAFIESADSRVELFDGWSHLRGLVSRYVTCSDGDRSILALGVLGTARAGKNSLLEGTVRLLEELYGVDDLNELVPASHLH